MRKMFFAIVICLAFVICWPELYAQKIRFIDKEPSIDGKINDGEWIGIQPGELKVKSKIPINKTEVYVAYNSKYLFMAFVCHEREMAKIKAKIHAFEARDTNIWTDDCIEIFLDPLASGKEFYQFIINSNGIFYDALNQDSSWNSNIKVAVNKYKDQWIVETAIPFSDFNYTPSGGEQWCINLCREQKQHKENSSLFPAKKFMDPASFGPFEFQKQTSPIDNIKLSIGQLWNPDSPSVKLSVKNNAEQSQKIRVGIFSTIGTKLFSKTVENITLESGKTAKVTLPYKTSSEKQSVMLVVSNKSTNRVIYNNRFELVPQAEVAGLSKKVWNVTDPLYEELFSSEPFPLGNEGALCWIPGAIYDKMRTIAKQFGLSYHYESIFEQYAKNKLRAFTQYGTLINPAYRRDYYSQKTGMKNVVFADPRAGCKGKLPFSSKNKRPFYPDPITMQAINQMAVKALQNSRDIIWGISVGDEVEKLICVDGIQFLNDYSEAEYPFIHKANQEVKNLYGYGKYGMPINEHDDNPFRWIAYRRWINRQMVKIHKGLYKTVKDITPDVKVIGNDAVAFHAPLNYKDRKFDIGTHQLYPRRNADRARFGFLTKLNVDLSGNREFWPVAHVENYAGNFNYSEVLELMSQIIRNGGSGFHFWPIDIANLRTGKNSLYCDSFAAPLRWQLQMNIVKELEKIKKLKFPDSDFAIWFSTDSHASIPFGRETYEVESAYTFLGPVARSYFTFVDDYWVEYNPEKLSKYKVLYVPFGKYMRKKIAENLVEYVKNGGTLISGDPEIFSFCTDGTSLKDISKKLFGVSLKSEKKHSYIKYKELVLPVYSKSYSLQLSKPQNIKIIAAYNDGTPAITEHKYGKGKAILFAANPFKIKGLSDKSWKSFFTIFQKEYGLKIGFDIWRFQFPKTLIPEEPPAPKGKCLTNNHLVWRMNQGQSLGNKNSGGSYYYSLQPDSYKEQSGIRPEYSFDKGDLTDRRQAPKVGNVDLGKGSIDDWVVRWNKIDAFNITFDFKKVENLNKVSIVYSGQLPQIMLYGSDNGKKWVNLKKITPKQAATEDVLEKIMSGNLGKHRFLQIRFGKRDNNKSFTISEIEVWSI
jgi:hypothetical protein